ncbi:MAG: hypothetical protein AUJ92_01375 [Armatimonadetes bacterium CG2_30_59_28]|nr:type II toxin-antitoxin system HicB family antitoxin [Armatimonadota bacterium]OIO98451.1 MAG: hypothetical protein AUJ92_01375 [Armatimonadetes bacterium CG2_30_59_28]PIU63295.1 MAG: type II toxin-antitoxin system HicB family antitoxin [Armatimonadetes bacterium CG07_land_8_20_14_0_80_59_28]PIX40920.1 MAG: type II toxin-antitoxin system HicB family antitoxin [Armatimonadetes bacterium CG_4_8_14_3_um_filter_58_9]PIY38086.1 MAG: type II toxin-antitoxin system HicB family antitoxin [Armatimona
MSNCRFSVVVETDEDGVYIASCPALKGCYTQGDTYEEAMENIRDAIRLHIDARQAIGEVAGSRA